MSMLQRSLYRRNLNFVQGLTRQLLLLGVVFLAAVPSHGADWYVAPNGKATGRGTLDKPWDIESALGGKQRIGPGDTLWLREGSYRRTFEVVGKGYPVHLAGTKGSPIHVRPYKKEHVIIDGGLNIQPPSAYVWIHDLEVTVTDPRPKDPVPKDKSYQNTNRPLGGVNLDSATAGCKLINLVIHDNGEGIRLFQPATDVEVHGCLIYDNGWVGTDRKHGPGIYTQNKDGVKTISDCIFPSGYEMPAQAYGSSKAYVDNYVIEGNILYGNYAEPMFLIGGARPSRGIHVLNNYLYGVGLKVGYRAPYNEDCEVRNNMVVDSSLWISNYRNVVDEGNVILKKGQPRPAPSVLCGRTNMIRTAPIW